MRFVIRVAQEFQIETETLAEAYAEMNRLADRTDERATLVRGEGWMAPASVADRAQTLAEPPSQ